MCESEREQERDKSESTRKKKRSDHERINRCDMPEGGGKEEKVQMVVVQRSGRVTKVEGYAKNAREGRKARRSKSGAGGA